MLDHKKKGFSLIELLIVLAVLCGIILVVIPKMKKAREVSNIKKDISMAVNISNEAIILQKQGVIISSESWSKASDIKVIAKDGTEKTLAECADVNTRAKAKGVKGCEFYIKLNDEGSILVAVKEPGKDKEGKSIDVFRKVYPSIYADEPYKSNY